MLVENDDIVNIDYHNKRFNNTLQYLSPGHEKWELSNYIYPLIRQYKEDNSGLVINNFKARVLYDKNRIIDVNLSPYNIRKVNSLKCLECDDIDYTYKSADRNTINQLFSLRGECDDILIIKNGMLTDTSICNVALWDGRKWFTPKAPLLKGTRRASLIDAGVVEEDDVCLEDITHFQKICLFNAMIGWRKIELNIDNILLP